MNRDVIITCAVTGSGDSASKSEHVPVTPAEIATASIDAAKAGAAIVHIHVREPDTGAPSRRVELYQEVVDRIRDSDTDVVINLTTGMGGDLYLGPDDNPLALTDDTDCVGEVERLAHVEKLLPEICSMDCGSFNYPGGNYVYISSPDMLELGAKRLQAIRVKPELEVFDLGHIWFAKGMLEDGLLDAPPLFQICLGIRWGAQDLPRNFQTMVDNLPSGANWAGFAIGAMEMPMVAQAVLLGGHVRVGLEDNIYLSRGVKASNAQLVERARQIVELMGAEVQTPEQARQTLQLKRQVV
ncbi:MAG: NADPH:quinone reductase [Gammaproteobacteria bacterium]|uniref:NADPH:quinone reductase n=1 Tax=OM182 bacterium MED-G24 TaxID=1986255 RepID=A0A2A5WYS9_9GAMM|nr:NADPH:quinone reductase [Gammaproteobacteria bacterium]PDH41710.1 MAG: NADPH:quinone reductase [OM182 bacterium MED-G24]RPG26627.1 MAG: 3-keto-5-aminohexanoate cleavage protein [Gammaproteobacteria bacterium TMED50]|tara:strand:+ start:797 stop:1690 length:894 start_codon:yes stop_codon:yes gene_type:complete